jgi:hypothetical protein
METRPDGRGSAALQTVAPCVAALARAAIPKEKKEGKDKTPAAIRPEASVGPSFSFCFPFGCFRRRRRLRGRGGIETRRNDSLSSRGQRTGEVGKVVRKFRGQNPKKEGSFSIGRFAEFTGCKKIGNATDGRTASAVGRHSNKEGRPNIFGLPLVGRSFWVFRKRERERKRRKKETKPKQGRGRRRLVHRAFSFFASLIVSLFGGRPPPTLWTTTRGEDKKEGRAKESYESSGHCHKKKERENKIEK